MTVAAIVWGLFWAVAVVAVWKYWDGDFDL